MSASGCLGIFPRVFDWNRDGDFNDAMTCNEERDAPEWAVQNQLIQGELSPGTYVFATPFYLSWNAPDQNIDCIWMRISIAEQLAPTPQDGRGPAGGYAYGETEDYFLTWMCPECADFDGNFIVDLADLEVVAGDWLWNGLPGGLIDADLNCDGHIKLDDFAILARQWLGGCP